MNTRFPPIISSNASLQKLTIKNKKAIFKIINTLYIHTIQNKIKTPKYQTV